MGKGRDLADDHQCDWRTIKGARVCIASSHRGNPNDGRIVMGGPHRWRGLHVRDIAIVERKRRKILKLDCHQALRAELRKRGIGFAMKSKLEGARIIKSLNPDWFDSTDPEAAADLAKGYLDRPGLKNWRGLLEEDSRRGGKRRMSASHRPLSWLKVLAAILPSSRRWQEAPSRLEELRREVQRSTDHHLPPIHVPSAVYEIEELERQYEDCGLIQQHLLEELLGRAVHARVGKGGRKTVEFELSDVPF